MKKSIKAAFGVAAATTALTLAACGGSNFYEKQEAQILKNNEVVQDHCKKTEALMRAQGKGGITKNDSCYNVMYGGFDRN